jgi:hypothetical protein
MSTASFLTLSKRNQWHTSQRGRGAPQRTVNRQQGALFDSHPIKRLILHERSFIYQRGLKNFQTSAHLFINERSLILFDSVGK